MSTPHGWNSRIWTEQIFLAHLNDQQIVEIRTKERMPQSFRVSRSLFSHYCPKAQLARAGGPFDFETSNRGVLLQFFKWLHTGNIAADADWYMATELYFIAAQVGSIALARSAMTQLQKACREPNKTDLSYYGYIAVVEDMVGTESALFRYIEDTYFNHWSPDSDAHDNAPEHEKPGLFFKKLYERSFREQRDTENCSCRHDHCRYHDHESEAERLATCGHLASHTLVVNASVHDSTKTVEPGLPIRTSRKSKAAVRKSMNTLPMSEDEDSLLRETRFTASRAGTPRVDPATGSWLKEKCSAPADFPDDYHGLLTSLPQVKSIKAPDCFFNQYNITVRNRNHWLNTLKFGGPRQRERAGMLLAMWECLGWLEGPEVVTNKELDCVRGTVTSRTRQRASTGSNTAWSQKEKDAVGKIMGEIEEDQACVSLGLLARSRLCAERLKTQYGHIRTDNAVHAYWSTRRALADPVAPEGVDQGNHVVSSTIGGQIADENKSENNSQRRGFGVAWTAQETKAMFDFMNAFDNDPTISIFSTTRRNMLCSAHLKATFDTDRTAVAINVRYNRARREAEAEAQIRDALPNTHTDYTALQRGPATVVKGATQHELKTPLMRKQVISTTPAGHAATGSPAASSNHTDSAHLTAIDPITKRSERRTEEEHDTMIKVYKEIEASPALVNLNVREREKLCSGSLKARNGIERSAHSIKGRMSRSDLTKDTSAKRARDDNNNDDDLEPLMTRQKRRQGKFRFVNELFDAGEE
ncbi:hypothetical protein AUEXF2481DRAFT_89104 [Aureobasidium subglaciale EXF-2481]|uniref:BTB domain-containing protein n=1 Tax=Aureobasidium subglaciale (strain EXF-2481) TaxID=1043005 RepID=A0A074Z867_AURSE|nr:uncharacterized protein AUEXF2481DRAFT_89104 [Aureobasidium subglaciale EXF-2481]KEQ95046.1 hypothetical protein AUEXF2481DRAFT_89104 [Aureobasidium subglaciale EXF-2481]